MAGDRVWPINQQKRAEAFPLALQCRGAPFGFRNERIIPKIRHGQAYPARLCGFGEKRIQFGDLGMQAVILLTRPAMGGSGNRDSHIGKSRAVQHHQRVPAAA